MTAEPRDDHSSYLASWLGVLKDDHRAISPPPHRRNAQHYLHGLQQRQDQRRITLDEVERITI